MAAWAVLGGNLPGSFARGLFAYHLKYSIKLVKSMKMCQSSGKLRAQKTEKQ